MKFDFKEEFVNAVLQVIRQAPVAHVIVDPMLQEFLRQANDKKIQSLEYPVKVTPALTEEPRLTGESNG